MAKKVIRVVTAVVVDDKVDAEKVAQTWRESGAGEKVQKYLGNILGPHLANTELKPVEDEVLTHVCKWYDEDECSICRYASSYSLSKTTSVLGQLG